MNFKQWLKRQTDRNDAVGDLARDVEEDWTAPHANAGYKPWKLHLESKGAAQAALDALAEAWREFGGKV